MSIDVAAERFSDAPELGRPSRVRRVVLVPWTHDERPQALWSFLHFFALMCAYYVVRPVRDEMGVVYGAGRLQWLFSATFVASFLAVLVFGWAASRLSLSRLIAWTYAVLSSSLAGFYLWLRVDGFSTVAAPAFFVWVGVFNLFAVSVFWSLMADLYTPEQGRRLFGFIAAGGGAGTLVGPVVAVGVSSTIGPTYLLAVAVVLLGAAYWASTRRARTGAPNNRDETACGDGAFDGFQRTMRSPVLLGVGVFVVGSAMLSTMLYFQQLHTAADRFADPEARASFFAAVDFGVNLIAVVVQLGVAWRVTARVGLSGSLAITPCLVAVGLSALLLSPGLPLLVAVVVVQRAGNFSLVRPGKEVLFTTVDRASRFTAKSVLDTVVYRGSDALGSWCAALVYASGSGHWSLSLAGLPIAVLVCVTGFILGRIHDRGN